MKTAISWQPPRMSGATVFEPRNDVYEKGLNGYFQAEHATGFLLVSENP